ncbi:phosphoglycolate phosphatase [bacterium BMS3Bbin06]|nr:phosphoglycolate phosphatase [bacterium BMS3Abin08]GBE33960.1 phosphoglycolate phosphatase [bacterium BMS3Bbin06]HDO34767.1 HAD family hydrolase [Nitrospirota bacterium]HDY72416.1 HAD family hydrolase [Nitrospirota bacterium]
MTVKQLILFDIDGTLIDSGGAGIRALNLAFSERFGIDIAFNGISMAGKTDMQIVKEALKLHGIGNNNGEVELVTRRYLTILRSEIDNPHRTVNPGVFDILEHLKAEGYPLGLLTGNIEGGARLKLSPFGLNRYFPFGAFGSDHEDRDHLLPIAIKRFPVSGEAVKPEDCVIIGDTPRDVRCAHVHGASCIGVATGPFTMNELEDSGADLTIGDLREKEKILVFLDDGRR